MSDQEQSPYFSSNETLNESNNNNKSVEPWYYKYTSGFDYASIAFIIICVILIITYVLFTSKSSGFLNSSKRSDREMDEDLLTNQISSLNRMQERNVNQMHGR